jgi:hypothetical protein
MRGELKQKVFASVLVHRAGYKDRGRAQETAFVTAGLGKVTGAPDSGMVAYRIP